MLLPLVESLPGLLQWLTDSDDDLVDGFADFVDKFTVFRSVYSGNATKGIVIKEFRGVMIHWLMQVMPRDNTPFLSQRSVVSFKAQNLPSSTC